MAHFNRYLSNKTGMPLQTKFTASGSGLLYSSYLGGSSGPDYPNAVAVDPAGDAYVWGHTALDFPVTPTAFQPAMDGNADAFVTKFALGTVSSLTITGITPSTGGNAGQFTSTIVGGGFLPGATVELNCPGQPSIVGTNIIVSSDGRTMTATFNLTAAAPGGCGVEVTNPNGASLSQAQDFTIEQGGAPQVWVDIVGWSNLRGGEHSRIPSS